MYSNLVFVDLNVERRMKRKNRNLRKIEEERILTEEEEFSPEFLRDLDASINDSLKGNHTPIDIDKVMNDLDRIGKEMGFENE
jgi:hypothetical protein